MSLLHLIVLIQVILKKLNNNFNKYFLYIYLDLFVSLSEELSS